MEEKSFLGRIISSVVEKTDVDELLGTLIAHVIKDDISVEGRQIVPEKPIPTPVSSVDEVIKAIIDAKSNNKILRVAGSEHSVSDAISNKDGVTLQLTGDLRKVEILEEIYEDDKKKLKCRIGAGCYLGVNLLDSYGGSNPENSACFQVAALGYGFPELGGITHQSIGGFISTGSAGGSLTHSFADVIRDIEFVDGNGKQQTAEYGKEEWAAVGVSMGLFGVITHVIFHLPEMGWIEGSESSCDFDESVLGCDEKGKSKLKQSLETETNEYMRVNWFPQKYLHRVQQWFARQVPTGKHAKHYCSTLGNKYVSKVAARVLKWCNCILQKPHPTECDYMLIDAMLRQFLWGGKQSFHDDWYKALPMDNEVRTKDEMAVDFTEIWIPLNECQTVMDKLQELFKDQQACGNFAIEIYGAKETKFWLSMSYKENMVRVDPYWWAGNKGDKRKFFSYFWDVLLDIPGSRLHWGKYLPLPGQKCGDTIFDLSYLKNAYTKMDDWLKMREEMDPDQVFVTDYWRGILDIPAPKPRSDTHKGAGLV